jgi:hypothetical protein
MHAASPPRPAPGAVRFVRILALCAAVALSGCATGGSPGAAGGAAASGDAAPAADLSGSWVLTVESPNGTGTREVTFEQEGTRLTGTIASSMAAGPLEGTVEGDQVFFVATVAMGSGDFDIVYEATLRDGRLVNGTVDFGDYGAGTFTGERR